MRFGWLVGCLHSQNGDMEICDEGRGGDVLWSFLCRWHCLHNCCCLNWDVWIFRIRRKLRIFGNVWMLWSWEHEASRHRISSWAFCKLVMWTAWTFDGLETYELSELYMDILRRPVIQLWSITSYVPHTPMAAVPLADRIRVSTSHLCH